MRGEEEFTIVAHLGIRIERIRTNGAVADDMIDDIQKGIIQALGLGKNQRKKKKYEGEEEVWDR